jgi:recombination protein RecA
VNWWVRNVPDEHPSHSPFLAEITQRSKVCAWIDVSNTFDPVSAASIGVDLARLLWARCSAVTQNDPRPSSNFVLPDKYLIPSPIKKGLHSGGFSSHPRGEVKGLSDAIGGLLSGAIACEQETFQPSHQLVQSRPYRQKIDAKPWSRIE